MFYPLPWGGLAEEGFSISILCPAKNIQGDRWGHFHWSIAVSTPQKKLKGERKMLVFNEAYFTKPARVNPTSQMLGFSWNREILWGWVISLQPYLLGFSRTVPEHVGDGSHPAAADRESTMPNDSRAKQLHLCPECIPSMCSEKIPRTQALETETMG